MFFPDVSAGLREVVRVMKPGGRVSFMVWGLKEANPFFTSVTAVLDRFVASEPEDEDAPGAFRFARPGKLSKLFADAGLTEIREWQFAFWIEAPMNSEEFWEMRSEMSDSLRAKVATLTTDQQTVVKQAVEAAVAEYFKTGEMSFPAQALIVSGVVK
jgi:SAM-dependent methyltransferase